MLSGLFFKYRLPYPAVLTAALAVIVAALLACGGDAEPSTPPQAPETPTVAPTSRPAVSATVNPGPRPTDVPSASTAPSATDTPASEPTTVPSAPTLAPPTEEELGGGSPELFVQVFDQGREGSSFRPTSEFAAAAQPLAEGEKLKVGIIFVGSQRDLGWNQASASGADYLEQVFSDVEVLRAENIPETVAVQAVAEQMIQDGATIVIPTSFGYSDPIKAIIDKHPEVMFLHLGDLEIFENYGSFFANIWQLEYAAGRAAGSSTTSNKLGFIAAFPIPSSLLNINAFHLGAQSVNPDVETTVVFTSDWCDPGKQVTAVKTMTDVGVDALSLQQDCTKTVVEAAERAGAWVTGFHYDASAAAPNYWITGATWNWGPIMAQVVHEIRTGVYRSSVKLAGIEAGWAKLAPLGGGVSDETRQMVLDTVEGLRDGSISPFTGPIYDQDGGVRIAEGETATDEYLQGVDWLAQGIVGRTN